MVVPLPPKAAVGTEGDVGLRKGLCCNLAHDQRCSHAMRRGTALGFWSARKRPDIFTGRAATWVATRFRLLRCTLCRCLTFGTPVASPWLHPVAAREAFAFSSRKFRRIPGHVSVCKVMRADASQGVPSPVGNSFACGRHSASLAAKKTKNVRLPRCHLGTRRSSLSGASFQGRVRIVYLEANL